MNFQPLAQLSFAIPSVYTAIPDCKQAHQPNHAAATVGGCQLDGVLQLLAADGADGLPIVTFRNRGGPCPQQQQQGISHTLPQVCHMCLLRHCPSSLSPCCSSSVLGSRPCASRHCWKCTAHDPAGSAHSQEATIKPRDSDPQLALATCITGCCSSGPSCHSQSSRCLKFRNASTP